MTARVYVVENHALVREMIEAYVARMTGVTVCGSAETAEEALARMGDASPNVAIIDLSLPKMSGIDLVRELTTRFPEVVSIVLTGHREPIYREQARRAGCRAFILKDDPDELPVAIRAVLAGERYESAAR